MDFGEISSYSDDQVSSKIKELAVDKDFHNYLANLLFPELSKYFSTLLNLYIKRKFLDTFSTCDSIEEFQKCMAPLVSQMITKTTDGFSFSGEENLSDKPTLFMGNHRDISLDPAFLNYLLYLKDRKTVRIAIGDNLLDGGFAETLMRLNKSFIVHREIKGIKETLKKLTRLSAYINTSLSNDGESIWIAQKEGRANDGNDFSDEAVLKMLYLDQRRKVSLVDWVRKVNLTPISISYEYDPLDIVKAKGWDYQDALSHEEINKNDLQEMASGIFGYKGRVHLHICEPIAFDGDSVKELSDKIEQQIISNYHIWPSSEAALSLLPELNDSFDGNQKFTNEELIKFKKRFEYLNDKILEECLMMYARPLLNKEKARLSSGP
tara:strand:+ start:4170 stop:5306 length:1137 start_codon:yes stop_codon:yes gene_type:complete